MANLSKRLLVITVGGTDYTAVVSKATISSAAAGNDFVTFADAASGGARVYSLNLTLAQDLATTSLWYKIWNAAGSTATVVVKPYGAATASTTAPWVTGSLIITEPDGDLIGSDADASATAVATVDVKWDYTAKPTFVTS